MKWGCFDFDIIYIVWSIFLEVNVYQQDHAGTLNEETNHL